MTVQRPEQGEGEGQTDRQTDKLTASQIHDALEAVLDDITSRHNFMYVIPRLVINSLLIVNFCVI